MHEQSVRVIPLAPALPKGVKSFLATSDPAAPRLQGTPDPDAAKNLPARPAPGVAKKDLTPFMLAGHRAARLKAGGSGADGGSARGSKKSGGEADLRGRSPPRLSLTPRPRRGPPAAAKAVRG